MQTVKDIEKRKQGAKWYKDTDKEKKHPFFMVEDSTDGIVHTMDDGETSFSCGRTGFFNYVTSPSRIMEQGFCEDCYKLMEQEALKEARGQ